MGVIGLQVRGGVATDLAGVVALERVVVEAPHWSEAEYAAIVGLRDDTHVGVRGSGLQNGGVRRCLFVVEGEDGLVGFAVGRVIGAGRDCVAELESVVVEARARRGGLGRALCEAVVGWCRGEGAAAIELEVRAGSSGAIALYEGLEFAVVGRRGAYYHGPVEDALLMRLELAETK
jgi:[ribosomal protein S18]-alanine N-acetyltransferase